MNAVSCHLKEEDSDDRCLFRRERTASAALLIGSDLPQMGQAALEVRRGGLRYSTRSPEHATAVVKLLAGEVDPVCETAGAGS
jgi:hypothetical protein